MPNRETQEERAQRHDQERKARETERLGLAARERWQWRAVAFVLLLVTASGMYFYFRILPGDEHAAARWGGFGGAVGPFVALLNVGALLAALVSVHLQRIELRETREEMFEQRLQFELSAEAQAQLAEAQLESNRLARFAELAQRRANLIAIYQLLSSIEEARAAGGGFGPGATSFLALVGSDFEPKAKRRANEEAFRIDHLERTLGLQQPEARNHEFDVD